MPLPIRCRAGLLCLVFSLVFPAAARAALPVRAAIVLNMNTGRVLHEYNADLVVPPASLTKVMTMFLCLDAVKAGWLSLNKKIKISRLAVAAGGSSMHLRANESVPLATLLTGMAVASGNDAATTVALCVARGNMPKFVASMNRKAHALGMRHTMFQNPTGLPAGAQKTSARDMALLAQTYLGTHPTAGKFHSTPAFAHNGLTMQNTNTLLGVVPGVNGLKTGFTVASGYNIIVTAVRGKTRLLAVVLGGRSRKTRDETARRLIEDGFSRASAK